LVPQPVGEGAPCSQAVCCSWRPHAALQLSTRTVETHKYEMMRALGVQSTAELVRYAIHLGLV
jgi:hypothetical protein